MGRSHKIQKKLRSAIGPAIAALAVLAMLGYAVLGPTGLFAWGDYSQAVTSKRLLLAKLHAEEGELRNRVALVGQRHVDPDMADELVRRELGVSHPDEVIVPIPREPIR